MTMFKKSLGATLAAVALGTALLASTGGAEARPRHHHRGMHWGVGAGVLGALAVGGLLAANSRPAYGAPVYEAEPVRRCDLVERVNRYGDVVGYRRVCGYRY